jgi:hypothetical protein
MTPFDDNPLSQPDPNLDARPSSTQQSETVSTEPVAGDPFACAAASPAAKLRSYLPEDLRISWSWPHLLTFLVFGFGSLLIVQLGGVLLLSANKHLSQKQLQQMIESKPQFLV